MGTLKKVTVFGATGKVGKELLKFLSGAGIHTIAVTRDKNKAKEMPFVEWMEADMSARESLNKTIENSSAVFLASSPSDNFVRDQNNVIETAKKCDVAHIVKISSPGASKNSPAAVPKLHWEIEELLKASGIQWTILQPNSFMQNWLGEFSKTIQTERKIYDAAGDGKKPYIDTRNIAEVAFKALTEPEKHSNKIYLLTGGEALNYGQVATAISKAIGEKVTYISLTPDEAKLRMEQKGMPQWAIQTFLAIAEGQRSGKADYVNDIVQEILNKPPLTIDDFARDYAGYFK